jgi:putative protein kinase ArgK-like GTPase of G3E family
MGRVTVVVGVPGSGKSWVCERLKEGYHYLPHDAYSTKGRAAYVRDIGDAATLTSGRGRVLCETPFSVEDVTGPLQRRGHEVEVVVVYATPATLRTRGQGDEGSLRRQDTYMRRAASRGWFSGDSAAVLDHLKGE